VEPANEGKALHRLAARLGLLLGNPEGEEASWVRSVPEELEDRMMTGILDSDEELLVAALRGSLVRIAAGVSSRDSAEPPSGEVSAAIDGVELVIRGELVLGNSRRLPALLPGFVFLVTLPIIGQDEALDLSRRVANIIDAELGGPDWAR
jgi:hypothetical protein